MNHTNRDMSYFEKYQEENPVKYLGRGIKVSRFRKTKKQIRNRILYAILLSKDIKLSDLAKKIGVSSRRVNDWVMGGAQPNDHNMSKMCDVLNYPHHILFNEEVMKNSPIICIPSRSKYYKRVVAVSPAQNNILHGLLVVYDISLGDFATWLDLDPTTIRKYIHRKFLPDPQIQKRMADFFRIPANILFYDALR
ncbi:ribosome-binding protein aMBF1 (putative translation factor) [Paenibacillus sp. 1182]|uniref:helix-turn-helix domain-containing protein n=1 Tax=Paenibacillus sp. 1182 TaxID=2806565 RepID=UPI001AE221EF|nr:helix-turn-helix transcriptional regulator [Paenibacillus sp. 1182]MBP1309216.1 ribosome-binding protein aMBF1 (putative translation factor) [Paenibacillus sp. 1182]